MISRFFSPLSLLLFAGLFLCSCSSSDDDDKEDPKITEFLLELSKNPSLKPYIDKDVKGVIDEKSKRITLTIGDEESMTKEQVNTILRSLKPSFKLSRADAFFTVNKVKQESGVTAQDFTKEVKYQIEVGKSAYDTYTVTAGISYEPSKSSEKQIIQFSFHRDQNAILKKDGSFESISGSIVEKDKKTITFQQNIKGITSDELAKALKKFVATFKISDKATIKVGDEVQESGKTENDFSKPVKYTITAEDGSTEEYTVTLKLTTS